MSDIKYSEPQAHRYCDHPRPGSIYRLLDIPQLVRGPTVVLLPSGKEIEVPRMARRDIQAKADIHAAVQGQGKLQDLLCVSRFVFGSFRRMAVGRETTLPQGSHGVWEYFPLYDGPF